MAWIYSEVTVALGSCFCRSRRSRISEVEKESGLTRESRLVFSEISRRVLLDWISST